MHCSPMLLLNYPDIITNTSNRRSIPTLSQTHSNTAVYNKQPPLDHTNYTADNITYTSITIQPSNTFSRLIILLIILQTLPL